MFYPEPAVDLQLDRVQSIFGMCVWKCVFSCENSLSITTDHRSRSDLAVSHLSVSHTQVSVITMSLRRPFMSQHQDRSITADHVTRLPAAHGKVRQIREDKSLHSVSDRARQTQRLYGSQPKCRLCSKFLNFLFSSLLFALYPADEREREREVLITLISDQWKWVNTTTSSQSTWHWETQGYDTHTHTPPV